MRKTSMMEFFRVKIFNLVFNYFRKEISFIDNWQVNNKLIETIGLGKKLNSHEGHEYHYEIEFSSFITNVTSA